MARIEEQAPPPGAAMMQMVMARLVSQAIGAAARFGFADHLASGPKTTGELAALTGTLSPMVHRLLRLLAAQDIFAEVEPGRFANTPLSETLREGVPGSMRGMVLFFTHESHVKAWLGLPHSLQTGRSGFEHIHGQPIWQYLSDNPEVAATFNDAMTSATSQMAAAVADAYDFSGIGTLVDVGGGHGILISTLLSRYTGLRGVLFDLPQVVEGAKQRIGASAVASRCEVLGGDFFEGVPAGDAFILKHVIHDWSDEDAVRILGAIARSARPGDKVLLVEFLIRPGGAPDMAKLGDLEMLVMTTGGRERTEAEFADLFRRAGFSLARVVPTATDAHVLEAVRT